MFSLFLTVVSATLCFVYPLLLTVKSINLLSSKNDNSRQLQYVKFLFNYWIYYMIVIQLETSLFMKVLDMSMFNMVQLLMVAIKIWLFYGKGCLILSYYYLNTFASRFFNNSKMNHLDYLEIRFIDPITHLVLINSGLVAKFNGLLLSLTGTNNIVNSIVSSFHNFFYELDTLSAKNKLRSPYFLVYSLDYFCTIDNQIIYNNYRLTNDFLNFFSLSSFNKYQITNSTAPTPLFSRKLRKHYQAQIPPQATQMSPQPSQSSHVPHHSHDSSHRSQHTSPGSSPRFSPSLAPRVDSRDARILSEKIELLERDRRQKLDVYDNYEPRSLSDSAVSPAPESIPRSRSDSLNSNIPPNALSIDQLLTQQSLHHKQSAASISGRSMSSKSSRSRGSSIHELPYPVDI